MKEEMVEKECCQRAREDKEQGRNAVVFIVFSIYRKERSPQAPVFLLRCFMHQNQTSSSSSSNPPRILLTPLEERKPPKLPNVKTNKAACKENGCCYWKGTTPPWKRRGVENFCLRLWLRSSRRCS